VEITDAATEFKAEALADVIRRAGIDAFVLAPDMFKTGGFGRWRVMVGIDGAARACEAIIQNRQTTGSAEVAACPVCGYALAGLERQPRCPECGEDLAAARAVAKVRDTRIAGVQEATRDKGTRAFVAAGIIVCILVCLSGIQLPYGRVASNWVLSLTACIALIGLLTGCWIVAGRERKRRVAARRS
jgi:hypothetical protein